MAVVIALVFAFFAFLAGRAKMSKVAKLFAAISLLTFIGWLASGPGFAILNWIQSPSVDVPSVDINR